MANVPMDTVDVETGYADVVATLARELAKARVENSALKRHVEGEEARTLERLAAEEDQRLAVEAEIREARRAKRAATRAAGGGRRGGKPERAAS